MSAGTLSDPAMTRPFATLARHERRRFARHPLFLLGAAGTAIFAVLSVVNPSYPSSTTLDMVIPAALLGIVGLVVMTSLVRGSDRASEAAGAVAVGERTRTLALASAAVVPAVVGLAWYALAVLGYVVNPPGPGAVPFGAVTDAYVLAVMFALGVVAGVGGPLLGLVLGRWLPHRGSAVICAVLMVFITILMQGNFALTRSWRLVWPWTYFYGPLGFDSTNTGPESHWEVLSGSPFVWIGYLIALCTLGVLVSLFHDREGERRPLVQAIIATATIAAALLVLACLGGVDPAVNPIPPMTPLAG